MTLGALRVSAIALSAAALSSRPRFLPRTRRPSLTIIGTLLIRGSHTDYPGMSHMATRAIGMSPA